MIQVDNDEADKRTNGQTNESNHLELRAGKKNANFEFDVRQFGAANIRDVHPPLIKGVLPFSFSL